MMCGFAINGFTKCGSLEIYLKAVDMLAKQRIKERYENRKKIKLMAYETSIYDIT
jgi:hypothetical protein